jgi:hypothetical protein
LPADVQAASFLERRPLVRDKQAPRLGSAIVNRSAPSGLERLPDRATRISGMEEGWPSVVA